MQPDSPSRRQPRAGDATAHHPLVVLGDITVDITMRVRSALSAGGDLIADHTQQTVGGSVTNTAVLARRLGAPVLLLGRVGRDPAGDFALGTLSAEGVDTQQVQRDPERATGTTVVAVPPHGDRVLIAGRGANDAADLTAPGRAAVSGATALHVSGYSLLAPVPAAAARRALRVAAAAGVGVSADLPPAALRTDPLVRAARAWLPYLGLLVLGSTELTRLTGQTDPAAAVAGLRAETDAAIAVKRGQRGAVLYRAGAAPLTLPGMPVCVVDTTGAGDAFTAGLVVSARAGLLDRDPGAALVLAGTAGALATIRNGAGQLLPTTHEIHAALGDRWHGDIRPAACRAAAFLTGSADDTDPGATGPPRAAGIEPTQHAPDRGASVPSSRSIVMAPQRLSPTAMPHAPAPLAVHPEVAEALAAGRPVVALESTIISHGLPRESGFEVAGRIEQAVRDGGAVPATIALFGGAAHIGLTAEQRRELVERNDVAKASLRDLPMVLAAKGVGATTVAATSFLAVAAGIELFATGGLGGVHRQADESWDESADLYALGRLPITVVCAGAKSILDVPATLERLESLSVGVIGYRTDVFPGFYVSRTDNPVPWTLSSPAELAAVVRYRRQLALPAGLVVANPIAADKQLDPARHDAVLRAGLEELERQHIRGKDVTPFLLAYFHEHTHGASLRANIDLVLANATLAAQIAVAADSTTQDQRS